MNKLEIKTSFINLVYIYHIKYIIYTVMTELERMIKQKLLNKTIVHNF